MSWSADSPASAQKMVESLFKKQLIADAQMMNSKTARRYMKFSIPKENSNLVEIRMMTSNRRVKELLKFISENNTNQVNKDMAPNVHAVQIVSGSEEYIEWVKKQTEESGPDSADNLQLDAQVRIDSHKL